MKNKIIPILALSVLGAALAFVYSRSPSREKLDEFAKCLAEKNITMYGAAWCSHCQNEKKAFGKSFRFVPYVECPEDPKKCLALGIESYPTWVFPDGRRLIGEQGIKKLAEESGCGLP